MAPGPGVRQDSPQRGTSRAGPAPGDGGSGAQAGSAEEEDRFHIVSTFRQFLEAKELHCLRAWVVHFDTSFDQRISFSEFARAMRKLDYKGDVSELFAALDVDASGELSLEEIDEGQAMLWNRFRMWCIHLFDDPADLVNKMSAEARRFSTPRSIGKANGDNIPAAAFKPVLQSFGWSGGSEDVIYATLDQTEQGNLTMAEFKWLEVEQRRHKRKLLAKQRALMEKCKRSHQLKPAAEVVEDFKIFLRKTSKNFVRAWRTVLSPDGFMVLQKGDLFKACSTLGWTGDVRALYRALDRDQSGYISLEELDPASAEILAHFCVFIFKRFGSTSEAFRALDKYNLKKLRLSDFMGSLKAMGFTHPTKMLFHGLAVGSPSTLVEEDLYFLDKWKPPGFLVASPNHYAAEDVRSLLLKKFKNFLKAWRHVMDPDSSNHCNYDEFEVACKKIGYETDVPGAWRALDQDLSGFITLHELDADASDTLRDFRLWCDEEFGGVKSAFSVFDITGDNEVSYREFRRSLRVYGFEGDVHRLFYALDVERTGALSMQEVEFLDAWMFASRESSSNVHSRSATNRGSAKVKEEPEKAPINVTDYVTEGPGPAAYTVPAFLGAGPTTPRCRFPGAFSFQKRPPTMLPGLPLSARERSDRADSPTKSADEAEDRSSDARAWGQVAPTKPAWAFGSERRHSNDPPVLSTLPGPGHYKTLRCKGPSATCVPRRPLRLHPLLSVRF